MAPCTLSGIFVRTSFSFCSNLSAHYFSSCVSIFTFSIIVSSSSLPSLVTCNFVAYSLARDCTSCATLTCNLYNSFFGMLSNTNYTSMRYLSGICAMASLTYTMYVVLWKLRLTFATSWIVSSSFYAVFSIASISRGIGSTPLSCSWATCIHSRSSLMSANSFRILTL